MCIIFSFALLQAENRKKQIKYKMKMMKMRVWYTSDKYYAYKRIQNPYKR